MAASVNADQRCPTVATIDDTGSGTINTSGNEQQVVTFVPLKCIWSKRETLGFILDPAGRICLLISGSYLNIAILYFASLEAGCGAEYDIECDANANVGLKPPALVSALIMFGQLFSSIVMLVVPAIADYSPYRWQLGLATGLLLVVVNVVQSFVFESTWLALGILQAVLSAPLFFVHQALTNAYMPELTPDSQRELPSILGCARVVEIAAALGYTVVMLVVSIFLQDMGPAQVAMVAQPIGAVIACFTFAIAWRRLGRRGSSRDPGTTSLLVIGIVQLMPTLRRIRVAHPQTASFMIGLAFWEAAGSSVLPLSGNYLVATLKFTPDDVTIFSGIAIVFTVFGAMSSAVLAGRFGKKRMLMTALIAFIVAFLLVIATAYKPSDITRILVYVYGTLIGFTLGLYIPTQRSIFAELMPTGEEATFIAVYAFSCLVISWAPSLVYTLCFQLGRGILGARLAVGSLVLFFAIGLAVLVLAFDFESAKAEARTQQSQPAKAHVIGNSH